VGCRPARAFAPDPPWWALRNCGVAMLPLGVTFDELFAARRSGGRRVLDPRDGELALGSIVDASGAAGVHVPGVRSPGRAVAESLAACSALIVRDVPRISELRRAAFAGRLEVGVAHNVLGTSSGPYLLQVCATNHAQAPNVPPCPPPPTHTPPPHSTTIECVQQ
jgi:hypothetical protein